MNFSERDCPSPILNKKVIPNTLKIRIWNVFYKTYYKEVDLRNVLDSLFFNSLIEHLQEEIFIAPIDIENGGRNQLTLLRKRFYNLDYPKFYDFIESVALFKYNFRFGTSSENMYTKGKNQGIFSTYKAKFIERCNDALEKEKAQFRLVNCLVTPITNQEEIDEIEKAACSDEAGQHINEAIKLLKDSNNHSYRNSIKESISAVEATYRQMTGKKLPNIGIAIKAMENKGMKLPEPLKKGFTAIYGWTSSEEGIRHALMNDECKLTEAEARLMLVMCSAYVNYLLSLKH